MAESNARHVLGPQPRVAIQADLLPEVYEKVRNIARRDERPLSHVVREALRLYIERDGKVERRLP